MKGPKMGNIWSVCITPHQDVRARITSVKSSMHSFYCFLMWLTISCCYVFAFFDAVSIIAQGTQSNGSFYIKLANRRLYSSEVKEFSNKIGEHMMWKFLFYDFEEICFQILAALFQRKIRLVVVHFLACILRKGLKLELCRWSVLLCSTCRIQSFKIQKFVQYYNRPTLFFGKDLCPLYKKLASLFFQAGNYRHVSKSWKWRGGKSFFKGA